jgi:hypothetical protein
LLENHRHHDFSIENFGFHTRLIFIILRLKLNELTKKGHELSDEERALLIREEAEKQHLLQTQDDNRRMQQNLDRLHVEGK